MLTKEENDLLTATGPGTPCGNLLRSYWQPAALSEDLPPGGPPIPLRLFSENLVMFRDRSYPCIEKGGVIFTFMGTGEPPLLPSYEVLAAPDENRLMTKHHVECNWLQGLEGSEDSLVLETVDYAHGQSSG